MPTYRDRFPATGPGSRRTRSRAHPAQWEAKRRAIIGRYKTMSGRPQKAPARADCRQAAAHCTGRIAAAPAPCWPRRRRLTGAKAGPRAPGGRMRRDGIRRAGVTPPRLCALRLVRRGQEGPGGCLVPLGQARPSDRTRDATRSLVAGRREQPGNDASEAVCLLSRDGSEPAASGA
jgi:hypothetical protein